VDLREQEPSYDQINDLVVGLFLTVSAAGVFGLSVYPFVKPQFGGGAGWRVELYPKPGSGLTENMIPGDLLMLDENATRVRFLACFSEPAEVRGLQVPHDNIAYLQPIEIQPVLDFETACRSKAAAEQ
jgi:hypothetical protein